MKSVAVILLMAFATLVVAQDYTKKYDNVNIESALSNDRVLTNYIKCLLDKGACTREGRELKSKLSSSHSSFLVGSHHLKNADLFLKIT